MLNEEMLIKIKKEIEKTGFPLELRISKLLNKRGYLVAQSVYYIDEGEGKSREIDIRAHYNNTFHNSLNKEVFVRNYLIIECKKSENKPWVFLSSELTDFDANLFDLFIWDKEQFPLSFNSVERFSNIHPLDIKQGNIARSYFEAFKGNETSETIFKAINSVVKATLYYEQTNKDPEDIRFYYPLIVFSGQIFEAVLDSADEIVVKEVNSVILSFNYKSDKIDRNFLIPILQEYELPVFLDNLEQTYEITLEESQKTMERIINKAKNAANSE